MRSLGKPAAGIDLAPRPRGGRTFTNWSRDRVAVKNFVQWALANQENQCSFCGYTVSNVVDRRAYSLDHFAPQGDTLYPQWRFEPLNLVITCHVCNSVFKSSYDPIIVFAANYEDCVFALVHPYLDVVDDHVTGTYAGGSQPVGAPIARTLKGLRTIRIFKLDDPNYIEAVSKQAAMFRMDAWQLSITDDEQKLYKKLLTELGMVR